MTAIRRQPGPSSTGATVEFKVHFRNSDKGRKRLQQGGRPRPPKTEPGKIPRISRLMALAIHFEDLIRRGVVRDYADLARLGGVSRARISQIMDLLNLAPEIQEEILLLPRTQSGPDRVSEREVRQIVRYERWMTQRCRWRERGVA